jgi:SAM-dependent methyltransferase
VSASPPYSGPAERNKGPILDVLRRVLPKAGLVLEIASGTGHHIAHFAEALPALRWQPTDADPELLAAIAANVSTAKLENVQAAEQLDVRKMPWPVTDADALLCINMIHISPWSATLALFDGAEGVLSAGTALVLYGPYRRNNRHTAPSNEAFDASLRSRDSSWGVRDLEEVASTAEATGFMLEEVVTMPANNFSVIFRKTV